MREQRRLSEERLKLVHRYMTDAREAPAEEARPAPRPAARADRPPAVSRARGSERPRMERAIDLPIFRWVGVATQQEGRGRGSRA